MMTPRSATGGLVIATAAAGGVMGSLPGRAVVATPAWTAARRAGLNRLQPPRRPGIGHILCPPGYIGLRSSPSPQRSPGQPA